MAKTSGAFHKFFQNIGAKGGRARAKKYGKKKLIEWASAGGRPRGVYGLIVKALKRGPKSRRQIHQITGIPLLPISSALNYLQRRGEVINRKVGTGGVNTGLWELVQNDTEGKSEATVKNRQQLAS